MSQRTRREFLEDSMFATAAALAASAGASSLFASEESSKPLASKSPNERLSVAILGVHGRGQEHIKDFLGRDDVEITHICDADSEVGQMRAEEVAKKQNRKPKFVQNPQAVFDDKSIDLVSTATPNHWHALIAIRAMQAGKDVYVEKPVSHNVSEGRRIVETARKYNRMCQAGTQSRSNPGMQKAIAYVQEGKLGDVKLARGLCYKPRPSIGPRGVYEIPKTVDAGVWFGPAQIKPLTRPKFHYDWHWQWDYGCGDLGNQGIHQMDIIRWGMQCDALSPNVISYGGRFGYEDAGETPNTQVIIHDYGNKALVFEVRGLPTEPLMGAKIGVIFHGSEGYVVSGSYHGAAAFDNEGKLVADFHDKGTDRAHFDNFLKAVRSRKYSDLTGEILDGHLSSALCHTGNISYHLGEQVSPGTVLDKLEGLKLKNADVAATLGRFCDHLSGQKQSALPKTLCLGPYLSFDPKSETFVGNSASLNSAANAYLTRNYREGYVVPPAGKV